LRVQVNKGDLHGQRSEVRGQGQKPGVSGSPR